jgi:RNA ligase
MKPINISLLNQMLIEGYVSVQKHPDTELYIYNYTANTQYEKLWNELTLACRGLILDIEKNIVARPFQKFFNLGEVDDINLPACNFNVYEKMDGSLGILYWLNDKPCIATRGSFTSEQAIKGTEILHAKYQHVISKLDKTKTYLFEIIYPENRIVVDYGSIEDLVLLAIIDTQTGRNEPLQDIGFTLVKKYDGVKDIHILKQLEEDNKEGFVVQYENGFRVKVKFDEYLRLHKLVTMVSNITVWEHLMNELAFDELIDRVPDEFYTWVKETKNNLTQQFEIIENECKKNLKTFDADKETAIYFMSCNHSKVLFSMWKNRNYKPLIWKMIRPKFSKPFQSKEEQNI